jgi:hypothetical protein
MSEITKSFRASTINFRIKMKIMRKQLLNKLQQHKKTSDQESDEDGTTKRELVTDQDARKFIARLQFYFMQQGNEGSPIPVLETCANFVQLQSIKRTRQAALST